MTSHPIDQHVGKRLRLRRSVLGISQEKLADMLGITFQQVQKYEKGVNRIGSSRLFDIATNLTVPVGFFFDEYNQNSSNQNHQFAEEVDGFEAEDAGRNRETSALVKAFNQISDPKVRKKALELIKSLADNG